VDEWKDKCQASFHVRDSDELTFTEPTRDGVIRCWIKGTSVFLGAYFTKDGQGVKAGTGWLHE
jgi:hypothetical protein